MHAYDNELRDDEGQTIAFFSSHWAAVAAMLRASNPSFVSLGGDKQSDLDIEYRLGISS
jgi:hypothetical protein